MDWFRRRNKKHRLKKWWDKEIDRQQRLIEAQLTVRKEVFKDGSSYARWLESKGFEALGSGAYGSVLAHPKSDKVVKILRRPNEDGWLHYVLWAGRAGYGGKFAPLVHSYKTVQTSRTKHPFGVAVMERLDKTLYNIKSEEDAALYGRLFQYGLEYKNNLAVSVMDKIHPGMAEFMERFREKFKDHKGSFDLHTGNMMLRKDGTLVLTDPLASVKESPSPKRLKAGDFSPVLVLLNLKGLIYRDNCVRRCNWTVEV